MEKKNSIFAGLSAAAAPAPVPAPSFAPPPAPVPAQAPAGPENDAKIAGLEAAVKALQAEIAGLKEAVTRPPPPVKPDSELTSRLASAEGGIAELKSIQVDLQSQFKQYPINPASAQDIENVKFSVSEALSDFVAVKRELSQYSEDFTKIEHECRKALGEMQGYVKSISHKLASERFDEHLKETVSQLNGKLAEVEKTMYAGLSDLSSRLMTSEVVYGKIFAESEDRLRKGLEPDLQAVNGRLKDLRTKVTWLTDEYSIVMERKMRALEAKYSAFDVLSARLDTIEPARKDNDPPDERKR